MNSHFERIIEQINTCKCQRSVDLCCVPIFTARLYGKINEEEEKRLNHWMEIRKSEIDTESAKTPLHLRSRTWPQDHRDGLG